MTVLRNGAPLTALSRRQNAGDGALLRACRYHEYVTFSPTTTLESLAVARRVNVTGNAGVGKSTLARALGPALGLPVVHLDHFIWKPGWKKVDESSRYHSISTAATEPAWVIDGVSAEVRQNADAVVFIDLSTRTAVYRVLRRAASLRSKSRPELGEGFPEWRALRPAFRLASRFNRYIRPGIVNDLESASLVIHLTSPAHVRSLLRAVQQRASD